MARILHVTEAWAGGTQAAISQFMATSSRKHDHYVYGRSRGGHDAGGMVGDRIDVLDGSVSEFLAGASRRVRELKPDVVHMHSSFAGMLRLGKVQGVKYVYTPHCFGFLRTDLSPFMRLLTFAVERALGSRTDVLAGVSPYEAQLGQRLGAARCVYLPNAVQAAGPEPVVEVHRPMRVVTVGRVTAQKDPELFAQVAERLVGSEFEFTWIGDGDEQLIRRLEGSGVTVTGWLAREELRSSLSSYDLYLHVAAWEGSPISLIEAASGGLPIICREAKYVTGLGYPVAAEDSVSLGAAVRRYAEEPLYRDWVWRKTEKSMQSLTLNNQRWILDQIYRTGVSS